MKFILPASAFFALVSSLALPQNPTLAEIEVADPEAFKFFRHIRTAEAQTETDNPSLAEIEVADENAFKFSEVADIAADTTVDTSTETETLADNPALAEIEESDENAFKFFQVEDTTTSLEKEQKQQ